jgi:Fe-S oxidoreductase
MENKTAFRYYKPRSEFKLDIEDLENFVYDMSKCIKCKGCTWVDHTYMPVPPFTMRCPSAARYMFDSYGAYGKMRIGHAMGEGVLGWNEKALEILYACTLCGACDVGCKRNLDLEVELALESLRVKAVRDGVGPMPAHRQMADRIMSSHNCYGASQGKRLAWITEDAAPARKAEVLYFVGCNASFANKTIAQSTARILKAAGVEFMVLEDEWCCGNKVFSVGLLDEARKLATANLERVRKSGAKVLLLSCAEGYRMWKVDVPKLFNISTEELGFKVMHLSELVAEKVSSGAISFKRPLDRKVLYHDPCSLGRLSDPWRPYQGKRGWMGCVEPRLERRRGTHGLYTQPRDILNAIPGLQLLEPPRTRENAFCCGAGRGTQEAFPEFSSFSANHRLDEVLETGAEMLVSACPWCKDNFGRVIGERGARVQFKDISEIIWEAI